MRAFASLPRLRAERHEKPSEHLLVFSAFEASFSISASNPKQTVVSRPHVPSSVCNGLASFPDCPPATDSMNDPKTRLGVMVDAEIESLFASNGVRDQ